MNSILLWVGGFQIFDTHPHSRPLLIVVCVHVSRSPSWHVTPTTVVLTIVFVKLELIPPYHLVKEGKPHVPLARTLISMGR